MNSQAFGRRPATSPGVRRMPMPMVMPTVTAIPNTTPSTRSRGPRPPGFTASTTVADSSTDAMRRVLLDSGQYRPSLAAEDLPQVVLEVADVVAHQVFERRGLVRRDR